MSSCLCFLGICNRPESFVQVKKPQKPKKIKQTNVKYKINIIIGTNKHFPKNKPSSSFSKRPRKNP